MLCALCSVYIPIVGFSGRHVSPAPPMRASGFQTNHLMYDLFFFIFVSFLVAYGVWWASAGLFYWEVSREA